MFEEKKLTFEENHINTFFLSKNFRCFMCLCTGKIICIYSTVQKCLTPHFSVFFPPKEPGFLLFSIQKLANFSSYITKLSNSSHVRLKQAGFVTVALSQRYVHQSAILCLILWVKIVAKMISVVPPKELWPVEAQTLHSLWRCDSTKTLVL